MQTETEMDDHTFFALATTVVVVTAVGYVAGLFRKSAYRKGQKEGRELVAPMTTLQLAMMIDLSCPSPSETQQLPDFIKGYWNAITSEYLKRVDRPSFDQ